MLDRNDYKQYKSNLKRALTLPKYYLSKWDYFEKNISSLSDHELELAKILYSTLEHLTEEERIFLANKYRSKYTKEYNGSLNYKLDRVAAKEHDLSLNQYGKLRRAVESKFFHYLQNYIDDFPIY